ncbi:MAG TPA: hypothetical protein VGX03_38680, partial [Candidatus Binatia bacterium]|nr:hypothetical protein [Candidatus Binatia bacterium]
PTGALIPRAQMEELARLCQRTGTKLVVDETSAVAVTKQLSGPGSLRPSFYYCIVWKPSLVIPGKDTAGRTSFPLPGE